MKHNLKKSYDAFKTLMKTKQRMDRISTTVPRHSTKLKASTIWRETDRNKASRHLSSLDGTNPHHLALLPASESEEYIDVLAVLSCVGQSHTAVQI